MLEQVCETYSCELEVETRLKVMGPKGDVDQGLAKLDILKETAEDRVWLLAKRLDALSSSVEPEDELEQEIPELTFWVRRRYGNGGASWGGSE